MTAYESIDPTSVDLVINSHYHKDHTWGNGFFTDARVLMHRMDYPPMVSEEAVITIPVFFAGTK
jgi:glyoxylase-like metal-dependent hydrolase (beta-lactamase superfamily II)